VLAIVFDIKKIDETAFEITLKIGIPPTSRD